MDDSEIVSMRRIGVVLAMIMLLMAAFFNLMIQYQLSLSNLMFAQWDLDTITITDFSVEMKITPQMLR